MYHTNLNPMYFLTHFFFLVFLSLSLFLFHFFFKKPGLAVIMPASMKCTCARDRYVRKCFHMNLLNTLTYRNSSSSLSLFLFPLINIINAINVIIGRITWNSLVSLWSLLFSEAQSETKDYGRWSKLIDTKVILANFNYIEKNQRVLTSSLSNGNISIVRECISQRYTQWTSR